MTDQLPPPEDNEDAFAAFEAQMRDVVATEVTNVTLLDETTLLNRYHEITQTLMDRKEALRPSTDEGRDLHSQRAALRIELSRRGML